MDLCTDEETILKILASVDIEQMRINGTDTKNIFHHYAHYATSKPLLDSSSRECETMDMLFQQSKTNKCNVFMTCAIYGSGKALELLLHFVLIFDFLKAYKSFIDMDTLLHQKNDYGNTLLSIILQYKVTFSYPK